MKEETKKWVNKYKGLNPYCEDCHCLGFADMPYEEGETVATLCEWLCQRDDEYAEYARIKLRLAYVTLPYGEQRMTTLAMINGQEKDYEWICSMLKNSFYRVGETSVSGPLWLDEYCEPLIKRLAECHSNNAAMLIVKHASDEMVFANMDMLMRIPYCYSKMCKRFYGDPRFSIDLQYLKETTCMSDYYTFLKDHDIPVDYAEARESIYLTIILLSLCIAGYQPWMEESPYELRRHFRVLDGEAATNLLNDLPCHVADSIRNEINAWQTVTKRLFLEYYCISKFEEIQDKDLEDAIRIYKTCMFINMPEEFRYMLYPNAKEYFFFEWYDTPCAVPRYHSIFKPYNGCLSTRNDNLPPAFLSEKLNWLNLSIATAKTGDEIFKLFDSYNPGELYCDLTRPFTENNDETVDEDPFSMFDPSYFAFDDAIL